MTLLFFVLVPGATVILNAWMFRRRRNPWSLFTTGFATCWLIQGLIALAFGELEFGSGLDWYYGLGIAVGVIFATVVVWLRGKVR
jgi:hypothetical protein